MIQLDQNQKDVVKKLLDKYFKDNNYDGFFADPAVRGKLFPYAHFFTDTVGRNMLGMMREVPGSLYEDDPELQHVVIPSNISAIGQRAFKNCTNLKEVEIEDGVKTIGPNCFYNCDNLESVRLPNTITSIPMNCFRGCRSLKRINIPSSVKNFGANAFGDCADDLIIAFPYTENAKDRPQCKQQDLEYMKKHLKYVRPKAVAPAPEATPDKEV